MMHPDDPTEAVPFGPCAWSRPSTEHDLSHVARHAGGGASASVHDAPAPLPDAIGYRLSRPAGTRAGTTTAETSNTDGRTGIAIRKSGHAGCRLHQKSESSIHLSDWRICVWNIGSFRRRQTRPNSRRPGHRFRCSTPKYQCLPADSGDVMTPVHRSPDHCGCPPTRAQTWVRPQRVRRRRPVRVTRIHF